MNAVPKVRRFRKPWLLSGLSVLVVLVAMLVWSPWSSGEKRVAIPDKVCQKSLSSKYVGPLLPVSGEEFKEVPITTGFALPVKPYVHGGGGSCDLSAGGQGISIEHNLFLDGYADKKIKEASNSPGSRGIRFGDAKGYVGQFERDSKYLKSASHVTSASLYLACPKPGIHDSKYVLNVTVVASGSRADATTRQNVVSLISEATRIVARDLLGCKGADNLPNGSAKVER
ncbi:hypothetical protein [Streptomyces sp. NPDC048527]|uniref:hypothetical protein n=1 Tax=Streptomyces sp. NPDC048527 TaxID=3365568 RepID=UPI00371F44E8